MASADASAVPEKRRPIRSFVLRQGRVSVAQARACAQLLPRYGIPYAPQPLDLERTFGRRAPKILEIGFGMGETTAAIAAAHPENDYLGIEVHTPGVGSLLKLIDERSIGNLRLIQHDAVEVLREMIAPGSLDGAHIFFPDPWPKKRHHKRRIVQPDFVALVASRLRPGGTLRMATDWEPYAAHMLEVASGCAALRNESPDGGFVPRPDSRPVTRFEHRGHRLGHGVWDLAFRRP